MRVVLDMQFDTREGLDSYVRSRFGSDKERNASLTFEATKEELTRLGLSESSTIYGVQVRMVKAAKK